MTTTMNLIVDSGEGSVCDKSGKDSGETIDVESPMAPFIPSNNLCVPTKKRTPSECSHKVIEKRRRDRINKCLAELAHIVPKAQGTGKLEKAEVLELTVEYIKKLQNSANSSPSTNVESENQTTSQEKEQPTSCTKRELQSYSKGYSDCTNEVLHFMITVEATDPQLPCFQRLMAHLRNNCRLLVDFEKKNSPSTLDSAAAIKHRGQNKRNLPNTEGQTGVLKAKRVRNKTDDSPSSSTAPSGNSSDDPKPPPSISGMTLEDKMKAVFKNGNSGIEGSTSPYNGNNGINRSGNNGDKGNPNVGCSPYPHGNLLPFPNHGYLPSYGFPSYALLPTSAQYIPVPIHPGLAGNNLGGPMLSAPFMPHGLGGYLGSPMPGISTGLPLGNFSNILGGTLPSYGGLLSGMVGGLSGFKGAEGLPAHLAREKTKEPNQERAQDSSGSSENGSSGDEYNFSTTSSSNLSDVGIQTDQPNDHSDYYSAGSR